MATMMTTSNDNSKLSLSLSLSLNTLCRCTPAPHAKPVRNGSVLQKARSADGGPRHECVVLAACQPLSTGRVFRPRKYQHTPPALSAYEREQRCRTSNSVCGASAVENMWSASILWRLTAGHKERMRSAHASYVGVDVN